MRNYMLINSLQANNSTRAAFYSQSCQQIIFSPALLFKFGFCFNSIGIFSFLGLYLCFADGYENKTITSQDCCDSGDSSTKKKKKNEAHELLIVDDLGGEPCFSLRQPRSRGTSGTEQRPDEDSLTFDSLPVPLLTPD